MRQLNVLGFVRHLLASLALMSGLAAIGQAQVGVELPPTSEVSDQKTGSVLIYPLYLSAAAGTQENTYFSLTNQNGSAFAFVRLFSSTV